MPYPSKNTSVYTAPSKNSSLSSNEGKADRTSFLLKEDTAYILLEDGGKIILYIGGTAYTTPSKNSSVISILPNQNTHTWATETMTWEEELRTWQEVMTWSYQNKH